MGGTDRKVPIVTDGSAWRLGVGPEDGDQRYRPSGGVSSPFAPPDLGPATTPGSVPPTNGSAWPAPTLPQRANQPAAASPWWSGALAAPWRDPAAPAAVVIRSPVTPPPGQTAPGAAPEVPG